MRRIINCTKDTYITSKFISGDRVYDSNVGQGGTLDLYKLYDETAVSGVLAPVELTRVLLKFDTDALRSLTSSIDLNDQSKFKVFLCMNDIYGGQPVPSNYTLSLFPLGKVFDEGRGQDVISYRDIDACNWLTSSLVNGSSILWVSGGAEASGSLGGPSVDYYVSSSTSPLEVTQTFSRGDENLRMDITSLMSGVLVGTIPDNGFRLSFVRGIEEDQSTYFVKRFASRHTRDPFTHPKLDVLVDDSITDLTLATWFDRTSPLFVYNRVFGGYENFFSGSSEVTGSNSLRLTLLASRSINELTTSWSVTHSASITHTTSSWLYYSASFIGSQYSQGQTFNTGIYHANIGLSLSNGSDPDLAAFVGNSSEVDFLPLWQSLDQTLTFTSGSTLTVKRKQGSHKNIAERNFVVNITNLKHFYTQEEKARLRVFVQDYNTELRHNKVPMELVSEVFRNVHWRVLHAFTRDIVIPFDTTYNSTKLSSDGSGMYFDLYMQDLPTNQVYEVEFMMVENEQQYLVLNQGFRFKLIP